MERNLVTRSTARVVLAVAVATASATSAIAGVMHGELTFAGPRVHGRAFDDAVVWIAQLPEPVEKKLVKGGHRWPWSAPRKLETPMLVEKGHRYVPRVSVVVVQQPLEVRNQDQVWHGTFSVSPGGTFDLGKRAPGAVDTVRFTNAGVFAMRCDIHPEMSGWIVAMPNHAYARVDESGRWQLPVLPPGAYELHAWHPDRGETKVAVHLPAHGDTLVRLHW
jgi:hypothetical protein